MSDAHVTASKLTASGAIRCGMAGEERRERERERGRERERAKKYNFTVAYFDLLAVNKTVYTYTHLNFKHPLIRSLDHTNDA